MITTDDIKLNHSNPMLMEDSANEPSASKTTVSKVASVATCIPRGLFAALSDLALLPVAGILLGAAKANVNFNPSVVKQGKTPILLLHGSGFNESEWVLGRQFLKKEKYGSVFSVNYDGLVSNDPAKGIDDYAMEKVREKISEIAKQTAQSKVILIGHSMGGLIASYYAERLSAEDNIEVKLVITIASPWKGAPLLGCLAEAKKPKRYRQMTPASPFLEELAARALTSRQEERRSYYTIGSTMDPMVPAPASKLSEDPSSDKTLTYLGHYGLVASPAVWKQVRSWLDKAYYY